MFMQVKSFLKKALATTGIALLMMSPAHAIYKKSPCERLNNSGNRADYPPKPGPFAFSFPKDMNLNDPIDFYFFADFVAMQPQEDGLDYAIKDNDVSGTILPIEGGDVEGFSTGGQNWAWDYSSRVGLGGYFSHDAWNLELSWLWFRTSQEVSESVRQSGGYIPLWVLVQTNVPDTSNESTSARWHIWLNLVDASLAKPYHVSRYLIVSPFFGLRGGNIDQDYAARYSGSFNNTGPKQCTASNNFWGVGPRAGVNTEWLLGTSVNLRFLSHMSLSSLYGNFDVSQSVPGSTQYTYNNCFTRNAVNMDLQLGFGWGIYFNEDRSFFSMRAMYEFQQWWDQNWLRITQGDSPTFLSDVVSRGDLRLNGVSLRFQFDF